MAFTAVPSAWLGAGYTVSTGSHTISLTTNTAGSNKILTELTDAEADPTTGDIREIARALAKALYDAYVAQTTNVPNRMQIFKQSGATAAGHVLETYTFTFEVTPTAVNVSTE